MGLPRGCWRSEFLTSSTPSTWVRLPSRAGCLAHSGTCDRGGQRGCLAPARCSDQAFYKWGRSSGSGCPHRQWATAGCFGKPHHSPVPADLRRWARTRTPHVVTPTTMAVINSAGELCQQPFPQKVHVVPPPECRAGFAAVGTRLMMTLLALTEGADVLRSSTTSDIV